MKNKMIKEWQAWLFQTFAVYRKDFFQIIFSPMFFVVLGVSCFLWSFTYTRTFFMFADQSLSLAFQQSQGAELRNIHYTIFVPLISQINLLLVFVVPALTMRLFSEERKMKTLDLLLSAPLSSSQMVLGKFFSAYIAACLIVFVSFLYIVMTSFFADFNWVLPITAYGGMILMAGVYTAVGLFASTLTGSVVLSVILGVIFNLFLWFISHASDVIDNPVLSAVMDFMALADHLINFAKGTIVVSSVSYFVIVSLFFIFLSRQTIETIRWR